eukprot:168260-Rhodomonas_salina.5
MLCQRCRALSSTKIDSDAMRRLASVLSYADAYDGTSTCPEPESLLRAASGPSPTSGLPMVAPYALTTSPALPDAWY